MNRSTLDEARAAKASALELFSAAASVVGLGVTKIGDGYGLKVNLSHAPPPGVRLATEVRGVPVRVEIVGAIRKRAPAA